jgi:nucleoid-associated protein YgaU
MSVFAEKATLRAIDPPYTQVEFQFNPTSYKVSNSIEWQAVDQKGTDAPPREFVRGNGRTISLDLFVDEYERQGNVYLFAKTLDTLVMADVANAFGSGKPRPPRVLFHWAAGPVPFPCVIENLDVNYTLFHPDGRPARADISLTLHEVKNELLTLPQNPTSGGSEGRRSHRVVAGETLDFIAYKELGDASLWKHVAEVNHLDNPFDLRAGQELAIEPLR